MRDPETDREAQLPDRLKILFLCTGNACRSQMAEGWARKLKAGRIEPYSAGVMAAGLSGKTVRVMAEAGVDISGARSKSCEEFLGREFDFAVILCPHAHRLNPEFPGAARTVLVPFDDPPSLKFTASNPEHVLDIYRRVRDEIRDFVDKLPEELENI